MAARNRAGQGPYSAPLAARSLAPGAQKETPWWEGVDVKKGEVYYQHSGTGATAWTLPRCVRALFILSPPPLSLSGATAWTSRPSPLYAPLASLLW